MAPPFETIGLTNNATNGSDTTANVALLIVGPDSHRLVSLPKKATFSLVIGRAPSADIRVNDLRVSNHHARLLRIAGGFAVEDLGSTNGTRVREQFLTKAAPLPLVVGDSFIVGSTTLVLYRIAFGRNARRILSHGYFESRLDEECQLSLGRNSAFAVLRIDLEGRIAPDQLVETFAATLAAQDIVASYGPNAFEVLMPNVSPAEASDRATEISRAFELQKVFVRLGIAHCPTDGATVGELLAEACSQCLPSISGADGPSPVVVNDATMERLFAQATLLAKDDIPILILGETGVGKEVLAAHIHAHSKRSGAEFLAINCAAFSDTLLESELFGHLKNSFTGAARDKKGLLETSSGGTIFLDEVGEMSGALQAKLLRAIEQQQILPVGATSPRAINVRFISATHRNLKPTNGDPTFRSDLFFRIAGAVLTIPPLRDRPSEIIPLARVFLAAAVKRSGTQSSPVITEGAASVLQRYGWPGNIRELRNVVQRARVLSAGGEIRPEHLGIELDGFPVVSVVTNSTGPVEKNDQVATLTAKEKAERDELIAVLERFAWNQTRAAKSLIWSRGKLIARIERYGIGRPRSGEEPSDGTN